MVGLIQPNKKANSIILVKELTRLLLQLIRANLPSHQSLKELTRTRPQKAFMNLMRMMKRACKKWSLIIIKAMLLKKRKEAPDSNSTA
jgi:hypothetical protein